jgi:hypothetical protein
MFRHAFALFASAALTALALSACSGEQLNVDDYDRTCEDATDCVGIYVGDCDSCACDNAAINQSDLAKYQGDVTALECTHDASCKCATPAVSCKAGKCALGK